ncbi:MAG: FUSC family protein [Chloroflexi bacterium]|nr:FUSC family protein [Chloroflexota bacterium]
MSVTNYASIDGAVPRLGGWMVGAGAAVLAGWLIWPRSSHVVLRKLAASVIRAVAGTVAAPGHATQLEHVAREQLASLRGGFVVAQRRPSGATRRDRALAELATELDRALTFAASTADTHTSAATDEATALRQAVVGALQASAALLEGNGDARDIEPLVTARDAHRAALDRWVAEQLSGGAPPETVLDGLVAAHPLRLMSMMALAIAQNAEVIAGVPTTGSAPELSRRGVADTLREELAPSSIWLRNSLRTGLAVAVAVFVARSLAVPFAFWVVLGTLSALRSKVSATGRSALLTLGGTALGVLIAVPFVGVTAGVPWLWWVVLPLLVFLAAYTPTAVSFVVGQVAFSMLVVVLFNILAPTDWHIGLVRVEDAALGVAISAVVGLLLWPRGAQGQLRSAIADLYDAAASSLSFSFRRMLTDVDEPVEHVSGSHRIARTEAIRAQEVFEQFLHERTRQASGVDVWAMLLSSGKSLLLIGDVLDWLFEHGYAATHAGAPAGTLATLADMGVANIVRLAEEIRSGHPLRVADPSDASGKVRSAALASLSEPELAGSPERLRSVIGLVSASEWLGQLEVLLRDLEAPVAATLNPARTGAQR